MKSKVYMLVTKLLVYIIRVLNKNYFKFMFKILRAESRK